jgi:UDP-glucose 4-epimerase
LTVVAITGISSGIGPALLSQLEVDPEVRTIVGLDVEPPPPAGEKLIFHRRSVTEPFDDLFAEAKVTVAVHLAFDDDPRDRARAEAVNVAGTKNLLAACHAAKVGALVVLSSASAYGSRPDNPEYLYEGAPLRATPACPTAWDHLRRETLAYEYVRDHPTVRLIILRCAPIVGPTTGAALNRLLGGPLVVAPSGTDPVLQLVHEDDATRAIQRLVKTNHIGVFNLAADGFMTLSQAARLVERPLVRLPLTLLRLGLWLGRRLGLFGLDQVGPGVLEQALHPCIIAPVKVKSEGGLMLRYDTPRAFLAWLEARSGGRRLPAEEDDEPEDLDDDELESTDPDLFAAGPVNVEAAPCTSALASFPAGASRTSAVSPAPEADPAPAATVEAPAAEAKASEAPAVEAPAEAPPADATSPEAAPAPVADPPAA